MKCQALKWDSISTNYYTGMILGNGLLGTNIYKEDDHAMRFDIGRTDVVDTRKNDTSNFTEALYSNPRLPIGRMTLRTSGKITGANMQLDIYNAEASGTVHTTNGSVHFRAFVAANYNVIYIEATGTGLEKNFTWKWVAEKSIGPRLLYKGIPRPDNYQENPTYTLKDTSDYSVCEQKLLDNNSYATVWKENKTTDKSIMLISVGRTDATQRNAVQEAIKSLNAFSNAGYANMIKQHRTWWNEFYKKSFVSLPDKRMESFYWIQLYKLASATRQDKPIIDLMGPWFTSDNPWGGIWWNLNLQLTYSPIYTANHLELGKPLNRTFTDHIQNLIANVPSKWQYNSAAIGRISSYDLISPLHQEKLDRLQFEPGDLTWALYYYYQNYVYTQNNEELKDKIYPLLKRSISYLIHLLEPDSSGVLHLPMSASPEYKNAVDANYTLASLRWGLQTLIKTNNTYNLRDKDQEKWESTLKSLVPYPVNETGFMIGKDVPLNSSHRHFSHLMMIYPYHMVNWDQPENRSLITTSLENWLSRKNALAGFSFSIAASMYASIGNGNKAYQWLNELFDRFVKPNTLYEEAGPVIETPLSAATSIQEMLIQSWGGKIRVFPAIPGLWKDVSFADLRTEGAFLISASRSKGQTSFIKVNSLKGGKCIVQTDMPLNKVIFNNYNKSISAISTSDHKTLITWQAKPGQMLIIKNGSSVISTIIKPVKAVKYPANYWGLKKKDSLTHN